MQFSGRSHLLAAVIIVALGIPTHASAQKIRRYDDMGSQGTGGAAVNTPGVSVQGATMQTGSAGAATTTNAGDKSAKDGEASGEEMLLGPSHAIQYSSGMTQNADDAQKALNLAIDELYRGIIPGKRDQVEHLSNAQRAGADATHRNELTWVGFHPTDEVTRVFLQTARKAEYDVRRSTDPALIEIVISNTDIAAKNFTRNIDTRFFGRNVKRVETKKINPSTIKVTIDLGTFQQPTIRESGNYIYLDFPYTPSATTTAAAPDQN